MCLEKRVSGCKNWVCGTGGNRQRKQLGEDNRSSAFDHKFL